MGNVSTPFGAGPGWLMEQFRKLKASNSLRGMPPTPQDFKKLNDLLLGYSPEQIYMAMREYAQHCRRTNKDYSFISFYNFYQDVPFHSKRLATVLCLILHFPNSEELHTLRNQIEKQDNNWFPKPVDKIVLDFIDDQLEEYKARL